MNNNFIEIFRKYKFLNLTDILALFAISKIKSYNKGDIIVKEGMYVKEMFFIRKGIIRTYVLSSDGIESTTKLTLENEFITCRASFLLDKPSTEFLEVIEDCKLIVFDTEKYIVLSQDNVRLLKLWNEGLKESLNEAILGVEFFAIFSPEERYKMLMKNSPELIRRVPLKYLASYLGVTVVSLSRIRKRLTVR